jgi:hypothetical protein
MSSVNARLAYLSGVALILTVCVIMALGEAGRTGSNGEQSQCDTICCDSIKQSNQTGLLTKCDTVKCDKPVGK